MTIEQQISEYTNEADGVIARIYARNNRHGEYMVKIYDCDAEEFFSCGKIFPTLQRAQDFAKKCTEY